MKTKTISLLSATTLALCGMFLFIPHGMAEDKKSVLTADDEKFVKQEAAAGMGIAKIADLAAKKSSDAGIKAFAEMLVTDHTKANLELKELAASKGVEPSTVIAPEHAETYQKLEKASGAEFDKEFLDVVASSHKKCVSNFEDASKETKDSDLKMWVDKMLPGLKAHQEKAKELAAK
jgi:putative membrane protein